MFDRDAIAQRVAAQVADDKSQQDPKTRGQIATLVHLVRSVHMPGLCPAC